MQTTNAAAEQPIDIAADAGATPSAAPPDGRGPVTVTADSCSAASAGRSRAWPSLLGGAAIVIPLALYAGWDWLAATGIATLLVVVAPCLLMCALGLCMHREKPKAGMSPAEIRKTYETDSGERPDRG